MTNKGGSAAFENAERTRAEARYVLRLYVAGTTPASTRALRNLKSICDELLADRYDLEVVDVYQQPSRATEDDILAVPTLVKEGPGPPRRIIGDLSARDRVLAGLDLEPKVNRASKNASHAAK